ncbi:MAG: hypothetical protein ACR2L2_17420 [Acidobacteriota bacterium]
MKKVSFLLSVGMVCAMAATLIGQAAERDARADAVVEAYLKAAGGADAIAGVKDTTIVTIGHVEGPQGRVEVKSTIYSKGQLKQRVEQKAGIMEITIGFNGANGWLKQGSVVLDAPAAVVDYVKAALAREELSERYKEEGMKLEYLPGSEVEGKKVDRVRFTDRDGNSTVASYDSESHLHVQTEFSGPSMMGGGMTQYLTMVADFREVAGLRFPFRIVEYADGRKISESQVVEVKINSGLSDSLFEKPHPSGD